MDQSRNLRFEAFGLIRLIGFVATVFFVLWLFKQWWQGALDSPFDLFFASSWGKVLAGEMLTADQLTGPRLTDLLAVYVVQRYVALLGALMTLVCIWYIYMFLVHQLAFIICYGFAEYRKDIKESFRAMQKRKAIATERQGPESEPQA